MKATFEKYTLKFKKPSGTSRGIFTEKDTYFIKLSNHKTDDKNTYIGECGLLKNLSIDHRDDYEDKLQWTCDNIHLGEKYLLEKLIEFPSIQFGVEQVFLLLKNKSRDILFASEFTNSRESININGLIWMGSMDFMKSQINDKIDKGFGCIKLKIASIKFEEELDILKKLRKEYPNIEIRVDANGGFSHKNALSKLEKLSKLKIHSIEQPIMARQISEMAILCQKTPLPIALDEELIGIFDIEQKKELLQTIKPQFIILKPSLVGGIKSSNDWIKIAKNNNIGYWITSALESNIGLNAIAQWTHSLNLKTPQGLGTGEIYSNNIKSKLKLKGDNLWFIN